MTRPEAFPEITIALSLAADMGSRWTVERARLVEELSTLYAHELDVVTDNAFPDLRGLLGTRATLTVGRADRERRFHGIIQRVQDRERMPDDRWALRLTVVPELWLLSKRRDSRIFPHRDVPRIVREVLDAAGLYPGDRLVLHLAGSDRDPAHRAREYCVQYQETDLDFLTRLLEEEGTTFRFAHDDDTAESWVIVDGDLVESDTAFPPVATGHDDAHVSLVAPGELTVVGEEALSRFAERTEICSNAVSLHDHDFTRFGRQSTLTNEELADGDRTRAVYEHPGRYVPDALAIPSGQPSEPAVLGLLASLAEGFVQGARGGRLGGEAVRLVDGAVDRTLRLLPHAPLPRHASDSGSRLATVRLQEELCGGDVFHADGNVTAMTAGSFFRLRGHPRQELDRAYIVRSVVHELRSPDPQRAAEHRTYEPRYHNELECFERVVVYRPRRVTRRPRIHGTQTATVVGGPGDEIHVDAYGRVRVQLHWDRQNACQENLAAIATGAAGERARDPSLVSWARCAQAWAGPLWGSMFVPRVGMEVVVIFEDGDPDRPLVVGCVYNDANPPPYELPSGYHRSTIRTRSIPTTLTAGRDGYNELRFDDLAGHEEIFVHAERDLTEVVRNHHETFVGGGQDTEVMQHQTNRVLGAQLESVGGNQTLAVGGGQQVTVAQQRSVEVLGTDRHHSAGGRLEEASDFKTELIRGIHLHYVAPSTMGSPDTDSDVDQVYRSIGRILDARREHRLLDPYSGVDEGPRASDAPPEDARPILRRLPLESYVVNGDRLKRVAGIEDVTLGQRGTTVTTDDQLDVLGRYGVSAGESVTVVVHGADAAGAKGLSMQTEPSQLDLFVAGQGLRITPETLRLRRGRMRLILDDDGVQLGSTDGAVRIHLGEDTTDYGLHVEDGGDTVRMTSKNAHVAVTDDVAIEASGKIVLKAGAARITLENGEVSIEGSTITANGVEIGS